MFKHISVFNHQFLKKNPNTLKMYTSNRTCIMHTDIKMYNIVKLFNSQYFLRQRIFAKSKYLVEFKHL